MKYLKLFENFQSNFPDVFNKTLLRGSRVDKDDFIDDPSQRTIHLGDYSYDKDYRQFMTSFTKYGIPDPTKSIHMFFRPKSGEFEKFGVPFEIIPQEGAKFGFTKHIWNGGLGYLYWQKEEDMSMDEYQKSLVDSGLVGSFTYDEIIRQSKESGDTLHVWTESPCLHKKIKKEPTAPKVPTAYKSEPILKDEHFIERGVDNTMKAQFYKENGRVVRDLPREEALSVLDEWISKNNI